MGKSIVKASFDLEQISLERDKMLKSLNKASELVVRVETTGPINSSAVQLLYSASRTAASLGKKFSFKGKNAELIVSLSKDIGLTAFASESGGYTFSA